VVGAAVAALLATALAATPALAQAVRQPPRAPARDRDAIPSVVATTQTDPVPSTGDAADDIAIWIDPTDAARSRIIATDKKGGLLVYDLDGAQVQSLPVGRLNNVDLRDLRAGAQGRTLVAASDRDGNAARFWLVDRESGMLVDPPGGPAARVPLELTEPYGLCLARDGVGTDAPLYLFTSDREGLVLQHRLDVSDAAITATLVRRLRFSSQVEGLVADDARRVLFAAEEDVGIWRVPLDPAPGPNEGAAAVTDVQVRVDETRTSEASRASTTALALIARAGANQPLKPDVEGLAIYRSDDALRGRASGVLIASSQGDSTFAAFERDAPHRYLGSVRIAGSATIDAVDETDGIEVACAALGARFPFGILVVQDGSASGRNQNFKIVPWDSVARSFSPPLPLGATGGAP
jgi:3-phytase